MSWYPKNNSAVFLQSNAMLLSIGRSLLKYSPWAPSVTIRVLKNRNALGTSLRFGCINMLCIWSRMRQVICYESKIKCLYNVQFLQKWCFAIMVHEENRAFKLGKFPIFSRIEFQKYFKNYHGSPFLHMENSRVFQGLNFINISKILWMPPVLKLGKSQFFIGLNCINN